MNKVIIQTDNAPAAIGAYSQAVKVDDMVYVSGQIPLMPGSDELISEKFSEQAEQVLTNLAAIANAADGQLDDVLKLTVYLTDLANFEVLNEVMAGVLSQPYPARAAVQVSALPKGAQIEIDAIMCIK